MQNMASQDIPDSKVHGANMGPIWGRQDPGGPHVGPMNFVIWDIHGLVQDCSNSSALAMELLQSCNKPSICAITFSRWIGR